VSILHKGKTVELQYGEGTCYATAHSSGTVMLAVHSGGVSAMVHLKPEAAATLARSMLETALAAQGETA